MAPYRRPVFSQDLDGGMLNNHSMSIPFSVLKDVTNKSFPCLQLSEETMTDTLYQDIEDLNLGDRIGNRTYGLEFLQPKALLLQLSLSQTQTITDQNLRRESYSRLDSDEARSIKDDGNRVFACNSAGKFLSSHNMKGAVNATFAEEPVLPAASQKTGSTELSLSPAQQSNPIRGNNRLSVDKGKRLAEKSPLISRERKKLKSMNAMDLEEDVQTAIGLTVATAETLVIADFMNGCQVCQSLGPKAILDAAFVLRRERDALGLNDFMLEDLQGELLPDSKWEEDLDDTVLEAECYAMLQAVSGKKSPCRDTPRLADTQLSECPVKLELAVKAAKAFEATTRNTIAQQLQAHREDRCREVNEGVQGFNDNLPAVNGKRNECVQAQSLAPKDAFNSRWLGGWTGVNCAEGKRACQSGWQVEKRHRNDLNFETSELTETCDIPPPVEKLLKDSEDCQTKSSSCAVTSMPKADAEALSTGSCAEILLVLSQASIRCSFQEPLCSFVPCSVNLKMTQTFTEPARCGGDESSDEITRKRTGYVVNGLVSGEKHIMSNEPHLMLDISPTRGTKRTNLDSLKKYSTISSMLEGTLQPRENHRPKQVQDKEEMLLDINHSEADSTIKAAGSSVPLNKSAQCELILEDSTLQDSPPLIWHPGKRRRYRACRIAESDLTHGKCADSLSGSPPVVDPANANCSEPEVMNIEECEGLWEMQKDEVQLLSHGNQLNTKYHTANAESGALEEQHCKMSGSGQSHRDVLETSNTKGKIYNQMGRRGTNNQIFSGVSFLVTGFPASQKNMSEEVCKKIQEHGGLIMSSIPSLSGLNRQKTQLRQHITTPQSIVIAPQKVRTLKYLYGCAAGLLIVRPNWLDQVITKKHLLFNHKERCKDLIFSRIAAYVHGQRSYCLKLSLLIQHGAGKVVKSTKNLVQVNNEEGSLIRVVVAEHQSKLSHIVKEAAALSGLPIVSGDWIIDSLLSGRLLALPATAEASKPVNRSTTSKARLVKKSVSAKKRLGIEGALSSAKTTNDSALVQQKEGNTMEQCLSLLGQGGVIPTLSSMGLSFVLHIPKTSTFEKLSRRIYHKSLCINGTIYTAGDIVEVRPEAKEANEPYVAQIESFYAGHTSSMNTRSAKTKPKGDPEKPCFLCCRWFYRPSDTGFPCVGNGKELYLSQHFDDNAPVHSIIKKVQMVLFLGEKAFINDAERGWRTPRETSCTIEASDYICRFFYDYKKESLHQLKAALTS